ncbi:hypothetical protein KO481_04230 [Nocardia sp. NEAU-G5]|uniref:Uncharacterized protein n=1 Tax=Nocardia albiluteola TaxID=2842303 RepID=A0ABS6AUT9_9NOCA|nr:hypothetical protein [Nocardia albiluteola]MBU3060730.1 hypothetical protein [Nocardia albiluteola]
MTVKPVLNFLDDIDRRRAAKSGAPYEIEPFGEGIGEGRIGCLSADPRRSCERIG